MARIGRQIPHYGMVDTSTVKAVFSPDKRFRYLLSMQFCDGLMASNRDKAVAVIMKNPSSADEKMADATIRKVETFVYNNFLDVRYLHILNIFAFRATSPGDLNQAYKQSGMMSVKGEENETYISKMTEKCDYLIIGWGNNSGIERQLYNGVVSSVSKLLNNKAKKKCYCVAGGVETKEPLHGLMWGYNYELLPATKYLIDT